MSDLLIVGLLIVVAEVLQVVVLASTYRRNHLEDLAYARGRDEEIAARSERQWQESLNYQREAAKRWPFGNYQPATGGNVSAEEYDAGNSS